MKDELKLVSAIPPSVNHYLAYRAVMQRGKPVAMSYTTNDAKSYKKRFAEYVRSQAEEQGWDRVPDACQHFYLDAVFYFPQIDMDANNYFKVMCDAITDAGCVWVDDNVVCERVQGIYYDSTNPRIEITIHPVDYIGVFDNASQLDSFRSRCLGCVRYKRNCSLLANATAGRIQPEIQGGVCLAYHPPKAGGKKKKVQKENNDI